MVKTTVYIEPDTALAIRQMAEAQRRSQAELIRDALTTYTRQTRRPALPGVGEFDSGHTDTSERADEILRDAAKRGRWR
jgi:predicted transcriptional regulator